MKKALITGIEGFVGKYLAEELLKKGYEVIGTRLSSDTTVIEAKVKTFIVDVLDKDDLEDILAKEKPEYIFHLAAISSAKISWKIPDKTMDVNIKGVINLLEIVRKLELKTRIVLIGSAEEYGIVYENEIPIKETNTPRPQNPYSISKLCQTLLAQQYVNAYNMDIVIMRAFNHIGPEQTENFVVSDFAKQIVEIEKGLREPVIKVGNLKAKRDFTDVRDIVRGYVMVAERGEKGEIFNIGSSEAVSIESILNKLIELSTSSEKIEVFVDKDKFRPLDVPILQGDCSKIKEHTSWDKTISLDNTLKDVLGYWRQELSKES